MIGPLSKLWSVLERAKKAREDAVQISVKSWLHYAQQTLLLLGQGSNAVAYYRRLNVLGSVMNSQYRVKSMFKGKASLLQKQDEYLLLGKNSGTKLLTPSNPRNKPNGCS